jgi:hypothetical protein
VTIEVRLARPEDAGQFALTFSSAFSHAADAERWSVYLKDVGYDRSHAAWEYDMFLGTAQDWRFTIRVPGGA